MRRYDRLNKKQKKRLKRALRIISGLLLIVLLFSLYQLIRILADYRENAKRNALVAQTSLQSPAPLPSSPPSSLPEAQETPLPSEIPITVDWDALRAINPDAAAWLYSEGTPINYPVMQAKDNDYYLTRGADGRKSTAGALYFDCRNNVAAPDANLIVYGHRMKDDSMFGSIPDYSDKSYYEKHPVMYLLTEAQSYRVEIFACRTVRADMKYFETAFASEGKYKSYLAKIMSQSYWATELSIDDIDSIITLVTCSSYAHADDPRLLVHGRLIPVE